MEDSILSSIAQLIGCFDDPNPYEKDLIIHINTTLNILTRLGVGPKNGFRITGKDETWSMFTNDEILFDMAKTYVYLKTKLIFDPPLSSSVLESMKQTIAELEWRLNDVAEFGGEEV